MEMGPALVGPRFKPCGVQVNRLHFMNTYMYIVSNHHLISMVRITDAAGYEGDVWFETESPFVSLEACGIRDVYGQIQRGNHGWVNADDLCPTLQDAMLLAAKRGAKYSVEQEINRIQYHKKYWKEREQQELEESRAFSERYNLPF